MKLREQVAVVTGGGSGIGRATAELFAREGATVFIVDRYADTAQAVADRVEADGGTAIAVECDVADESAIDALATQVRQRSGSLDVLVNNAGIRHYGPVTEASRADWDEIFSVNLRGAALISAKLLPLMIESGGGAVVNVSSVHAWSGRPGMALYDSMKAGLLGLTRSMACDHADQLIRVNAVLPGATLTEFHLTRAEREGWDLDESVTERHEGGPALLKRQAKAEEIAAPILFLSCADSSYVTGAVLAVDGGHSATTQAS